jgi:CRP-like cAMP-binding protein
MTMDSTPRPWPSCSEMPSSITTQAGCCLFRQGDRIRAIYVLLHGAVKLHVSVCDGRCVATGIRGTHSLLAAVPAILGAPHQDTAITLTACELGVVPVLEFLTLQERTSDFRAWVAAKLAEEAMDRLHWQTAMAAVRDCRGRLEFVIGRLAAAAGYQPGTRGLRLQVPVGPQFLADVVQFSRQQVSVALRSMADDGLIVRHDGWVSLPPSSELARIAQSGVAEGVTVRERPFRFVVPDTAK